MQHQQNPGAGLALVESRSVRDQHISRVDVLDKVKALTMLPGDTHLSVEMAATYYEVHADAIEKHIRTDREELESDGLEKLVGARLSAFKAESGYRSRAGSLTIIPRRALLRLGMLLRDSTVAIAVRDYLLDAERHAQAPVLTEADRRAAAAKRDLSVIEAMGGIVDADYQKRLALHTWASYRQEVPDIPPPYRVLMTQPYLAGRGVSRADINSITSNFGKRVKAAYIAEYGREPDQVPALIHNRERPVAGYYERDRFLFDSVFDEYYTHLVTPRLAVDGPAGPDDDDDDRPMFMLGSGR